MIGQLAAAVAFLTRLPVAPGRAFDAKAIARSARWFPLVGALVGGMEAAALRWLAPVFPAAVAAVLVVALDAAVTGAMHFDGLADSADGLGGGRTREDALRIMRDHAIGSYGAVALLLALALKIAAVAALAGTPRAVAALILAPVLGRWSAVLLGATMGYARPVTEDGPQAVGSPTRFMGRTELTIATATALAAAAGLGRWRGAVACLLVAAAGGAWGFYCRRRLGGVTGDTLGAGVEAAECLVLLVFAAR